MKKLGVIASLLLVAFLAVLVVPAGAQTASGTTEVSVPVVEPMPSSPAPASVTTNLNLFPSLAPKPAAAKMSDDSGHKFDVFIGYSFLNNNVAFQDSNTGTEQIVHGYAASVTFNLNKNFGILADFSGHNGSSNQFGVDQDEDQYYFLFGPAVSHSFGKARISGHVTVGVARQHYSDNNTANEGGIVSHRDTNFAAGVGGAFDWMFRERWGWRVLQFDYLTSNFNGQFSTRINNVRGSTGLIVRF